MHVPIGYLFTLTVVGVCAVAALIRVRRFGRRGRVVYLLTVAINEIPHVAALWLALATTLALAEGDLSGAAGLVLVALAGLVLLGLAELTRRGLQARPAIDASVRLRGVQPRRHRGSRLRPLLFPFPWRPQRVTRIDDLAYGEHRRQRLDLYRSKNREHRGPVLVYFHGGGYSSGGKRREGKALLHHLASRGWVCISATYRLRPYAGFTDHLDDARAALRWAHDNADVHGGDTSTMVMAGSSAGAHLTSLCALTQDPSRPQRPRIDAAVCLYAWYDRYFGRGPDESSASTPLALDPSSAPPFFIAHGDHDSWVPVEKARAFRQHLASGSPNEVWYAELPGAQHGFDALLSWRNAAVIEGINAFLDHVAAQRGSRLSRGVQRHG